MFNIQNFSKQLNSNGKLLIENNIPYPVQYKCIKLSVYSGLFVLQWSYVHNKTWYDLTMLIWESAVYVQVLKAVVIWVMGFILFFGGWWDFFYFLGVMGIIDGQMDNIKLAIKQIY